MTSYAKRSNHHVTSAGQKKKSGSPTIIEPVTFRNRSDALTTELQRTRGKLGHIQGSCMTCVLVLRVDGHLGVEAVKDLQIASRLPVLLPVGLVTKDCSHCSHKDLWADVCKMEAEETNITRYLFLSSLLLFK